MARLDKIWSFHVDVLHTDYIHDDIVNDILRIVLEIEHLTPVTTPLDEPWSVLAASAHVCSAMGLFKQQYTLNDCIPKPNKPWEDQFKKKWVEKILEFHPEFNEKIKSEYLGDLLILVVQSIQTTENFVKML